MTKKLNDILAGVKSSKIETPNLKTIYQWNAKDGIKFISKHKIEKHEDRVGNDDEVYKGKTKKADYKSQSDGVYEETENLEEKMKEDMSCSGKSKKKMLLDKQMKESSCSTPSTKIQNPFSSTTGSNTAKETTPKKETATTPKSLSKVLNKEEVENLDEISREKALSYAKSATNRASEIDKEVPYRTNSNSEKYDDSRKEKSKRLAGAKLAADKYYKKAKVPATEEVENLDEISKKLTGNYFKKSAEDYRSLSNVQDMARHNKKFSPNNKSEWEDEENWAKNKASKRLKGAKLAVDKVAGRSKVPATEEVEIQETAPPNPKIEKWIKTNKSRFVKEYGKEKGMEVLYAKAWKMHNESSPATNTDYVGPGAAGWTTGRMDTGTL